MVCGITCGFLVMGSETRASHWDFAAAKGEAAATERDAIVFTERKAKRIEGGGVARGNACVTNWENHADPEKARGGQGWAKTAQRVDTNSEKRTDQT